MNKVTLDRLMKAGWSNDRKININSIERIFKEKRINMPHEIQNFLQCYGMLQINFNREMQNIDIDDVVYPIGIANRGNLLMIMTENETFYRYTDGFLCKDGENIEEMLDCVVGECRQPIYYE